jgi:acyl-CoA hydrolase/RimJ/RimL family protein N-acetyltransferase
MVDGLEKYSSKVATADEAVASIKSGDHVYVGTACATPRALVAALEALKPAPQDVELFHFLTTGAVQHEGETPQTRFAHRSFFVGSDMRHATKQGVAEYVPISVAQVPRLIENGRLRADVALIQVSPPDSFGYVSLGVSVDITSAVVHQAKRVIAEVNPNMPRTLGDSFIHVDLIDKLVPVDVPVIEYEHLHADKTAKQIASYIAHIIEDGSTLQIGLGQIPCEALRFLHDRRNLGIHTDVITDSIVELVEAGILTGRKKTLHRDTIVASYCLGSRRLYDLIDQNPMFSFHPMEYVCDPLVIAKNAKMVSVTQAFAVDLTGQICSDQFEGEFYSGVSTQPDFLRGAAQSPGGKPIICLPSTTWDTGESRIRPLLKAGEGVTVARSDVHYVVTEYGIAYLFGKSIKERALALIEIAHPDHRGQLLEEARRLKYVHQKQTLESTGAYPVGEERTVTVKGGKTLMLRPARASDAGAIKEIFYDLSQADIYTRYFRRMTSIPFAETQRVSNVNYSSEMAFVAVSGSRENEEIVGSGSYFLNPTTNMAEVAYVITPDWQGSGLGTQLQQRLMEYAKAKGVRGFVAEVLMQNRKMIALAKRACDNVKVQNYGDTYEIFMYFD